jgi:rhodanese-related sulfurtransferase
MLTRGIVFFLLNSLWLGALSGQAAEHQIISTQQLKLCLDQQQDVFLVNVLPKIIHDNKHIPGSINIPLGQLTQPGRLPSAKDKPIVFYCMGLL